MADLTPGDQLSLSLAGLIIRGEALIDVLELATAALAECGYRAAQTDDPRGIADHVRESLATIGVRVHALGGEET